MIKILSPLKSVAFLMWCICGVFFQKWINRANKRHTPYHKGKTFPGTQYFDYIRISKVLHQNKAILTFWTPYIAKMALYQLIPSIFRKVKTFQETRCFDHILISQFLTKMRPFFLFEHPVWLKWPCISLVHPFFLEKATQMHHLKKAKLFRVTNILIICFYLNLF